MTHAISLSLYTYLFYEVYDVHEQLCPLRSLLLMIAQTYPHDGANIVVRHYHQVIPLAYAAKLVHTARMVLMFNSVAIANGNGDCVIS